MILKKARPISNRYASGGKESITISYNGRRLSDVKTTDVLIIVGGFYFG
jgi:hypothetical protein